jgi:hypothetical protein
MKTTLERVFETLNKVELKSEKVELSIKGDIKEAQKATKGITSNLMKTYSQMDKIVITYENLQKSNKNYINRAKDAIPFIEETLKKIDKMAAELDVDADRVPGYKELITTKNVLVKQLPFNIKLPELK